MSVVVAITSKVQAVLDSIKGLNSSSCRLWTLVFCCSLAAASLDCSVLAASTKQAAVKPSQTLYLQANSLAGNSRYQEALTKYKSALALDPSNAKIHHMYGRTLALMGSLGEAVMAYRFALSLQKASSAELENDIGVALATNEELGEAAVHLKKAVTIDPKFIAGYNNLGVTMSRLGDYKAARDAFQTSIKLQPSNKRIAEKLAALASKVGQSKPFDFNNPNAFQKPLENSAAEVVTKPSPTASANPMSTSIATGTESGAATTAKSTPAQKSTVTSTLVETATGTRRRTVISTPPVIIQAHKEDRTPAALIEGVSTTLESAVEAGTTGGANPSAAGTASSVPTPVEDSVIMTRTTIDSNISGNVAGSTSSTTTVTSTSGNTGATAEVGAADGSNRATTAGAAGTVPGDALKTTTEPSAVTPQKDESVAPNVDAVPSGEVPLTSPTE